MMQDNFATGFNNLYKQWKLIKNIEVVKWKDVAYNGDGYLILNGGIRCDVVADGGEDTYRLEREEFNKDK